VGGEKVIAKVSVLEAAAKYLREFDCADDFIICKRANQKTGIGFGGAVKLR
jgi:hypothetical protein